MRKITFKENISGWKVRICNGKCHMCSAPINNREGFFKLSMDPEDSYSLYHIWFCPSCFENFKKFLNCPKPDMTKEYETKYKEVLVRGIEKGNGN